MRPRSEACALAVLLLLTGGPLVPGARGDDVGAYLEAHGLKQLLAAHLEQELEAQGPEQGRALVVRLAALYSELLESTDDEELRVSLEQRCRRLLASAPDQSQHLMRLALLRGSYRGAERVAEAHRLRLSDEAAVAGARRSLEQIIPALAELSGQIESRWEAAQRQLSRSSGSEVDTLAEELEQSHRLLQQCRFVQAWSMYYQAWLDRRSDPARVAAEIFGGLLDPAQPYLQPADVSVDLRSVEAVARSVLGMALCKALTASSATALEWLELLEHDEAYEPLRLEVPAWKMALHFDRGEYRAARAILQAERDTRSAPVPVAWLRLAAAHGLEAQQDRGEARALVNLAITELASRGELGQILDLARRYGAEALGDSGFALRYVKAVQAYHAARELHSADEPARDPVAVQRYLEALGHFTAALAERDAGRYAAAAAESRHLQAWCLYFLERYIEARDVFEAVAAEQTGSKAEEALWMAIVCLDRLVAAGAGAAAEARLAQLTERFLEQHPYSAHAPVLLLKQAMASDDEVSDEVVDRLLAIPPGSEIYPAARRRAAHMLYQLYRQADGARRADYGVRFVELTLGIVAEDPAARGPGVAEPLEVERHLLRCRRLAEVALASDVERLDAARSAIDAIERLAQEGYDVSGYRDEIDYRRLKLLLLGEDERGAAEMADRLWQREPGGPWALLAARSIFARAHESLDDARGRGLDDRAALAELIRCGDRVLSALDQERAQGPAIDPGVLPYLAAVAEARFILFERGDESAGREALALYADRLLPAHPSNASFLRRTAVLAGGLKERAGLALECWRKLVFGLPHDSPEWFEAKFNQLMILADTDPALAVQVMDQHRLLHPDYGPDPWGGRLRGLDVRLERQRQAASGSAAPEAPP